MKAVSEQELAREVQVSVFRLPPDLLQRIDRYAERLRKEAPWSNATRTDAVRALLLRGLEAASHDEEERKR
jgi:hypothetical protein